MYCMLLLDAMGEGESDNCKLCQQLCIRTRILEHYMERTSVVLSPITSVRKVFLPVRKWLVNNSGKLPKWKGKNVSFHSNKLARSTNKFTHLPKSNNILNCCKTLEKKTSEKEVSYDWETFSNLMSFKRVEFQFHSLQPDISHAGWK